MAKIKLTFPGGDTIKAEGRGSFVNRVFHYIEPMIRAAAIAADIESPGVVQKAVEDFGRALEAADRGEDYSGEFVESKLEDDEKAGGSHGE